MSAEIPKQSLTQPAATALENGVDKIWGEKTYCNIIKKIVSVFI
jgi:hypothetical protein